MVMDKNGLNTSVFVWVFRIFEISYKVISLTM